MKTITVLAVVGFFVLTSCTNSTKTTTHFSPEQMDFMTWYAEKRGLFSVIKRPQERMDKYIDSLAVHVYFPDKLKGVPAWYNDAFKQQAHTIMDSIEAESNREKAAAKDTAQ